MHKTLAEYLTEAKRILLYLAPPIIRKSGLGKKFLNNHILSDDGISYAAYALMDSDDKHPDKPSTFRFNRVKWTVYELIETHNNNSKHLKNCSLENFQSRVNLLRDVEDKDEFEFIHVQAKNCLTPTQYKCWKMKFVDGLTYKEIGKINGTTYKAARNNVKTALDNLKDALSKRLG